jgi:hypothetical protein
VFGAKFFKRLMGINREPETSVMLQHEAMPHRGDFELKTSDIVFLHIGELEKIQDDFNLLITDEQCCKVGITLEKYNEPDVHEPYILTRTDQFFSLAEKFNFHVIEDKSGHHMAINPLHTEYIVPRLSDESIYVGMKINFGQADFRLYPDNFEDVIRTIPALKEKYGIRTMDLGK